MRRKIGILLVLLFITPLSSQTEAEEEVSSEVKGNSLPSTSKGIIHLDVDVADDAGIDTQQGIDEYELLPYNPLGISKWETLKEAYFYCKKSSNWL
ncbi:MAG: hypothetical protein AB1297_08465 [bacterium]